MMTNCGYKPCERAIEDQYCPITILFKVRPPKSGVEKMRGEGGTMTAAALLSSPKRWRQQKGMRKEKQ